MTFFFSDHAFSKSCVMDFLKIPGYPGTDEYQSTTVSHDGTLYPGTSRGQARMTNTRVPGFPERISIPGYPGTLTFYMINNLANCF